MSYLLGQADAVHLPLPDRSVDLVFGSPPYCDARSYGIGAQRGCREWVDWMLIVTTEALRVSRGPVLWVAAGVTRDRTYWPACEGLMWRWWEMGGSAYRPCYWRRSGIPGSGGDQWFRADVEYVMCFKHRAALPWSKNTAMGKPPRFEPGGIPSHRTRDGQRVTVYLDRSMASGERRRNGEVQAYVPPDVANPGNLIDTGAAGGGSLGSKIGHESEAPFPEALAEWFIRSLCPPTGLVLDPFSGSGTTVAVAERLGRSGIGLDIRASQARLGQQRIERPHKPVVKSHKTDPLPLFDRIAE